MMRIVNKASTAKNTLSPIFFSVLEVLLVSDWPYDAITKCVNNQ